MKEYILLHLIALTAGCLLDLVIGDPHGIPHPVVAIGKLISFLEKKLFHTGEDAGDSDIRNSDIRNSSSKDSAIRHSGDTHKSIRNSRSEFRRGILTVVTVLITVAVSAAAILIGAYLIHPYLGAAVEAVLTCYILAAKSLSHESMKVYRSVEAGDIDAARKNLSMIVGRDVENLDKDAIIRAAVETVAENTSDGVTAPLMYTAIGGPILGLLYKAVNTMDSMIGYNTDRYAYFGRPAARTDDALNLLPSRISALFMVAAAGILKLSDRSYSSLRAFRIWRRDRRKHLSPNSAQTESTCAGALGVRLGGLSYYGGVAVDKPYLGDDLRPIENADIMRAGRLMFVSEALTLLMAVGALLIVISALK